MDGTDPRIPDNSRVRLRGHIGPEFYNGLAKTGNEGWIRRHRFDRNGLPEVFIEWDREHWADNMQPDQWTYEEHFDVLEEGDKMASEDDQEISPHEMAMMKEFVKMMRQSPEESAEPQISNLDAEQQAYHVGQKQRIRDLLENEDLESFFFIGVSRKPDSETPQGSLVISMSGSSLTPETDALLGMQLGVVAAESHKEVALMCIHHLTTQDDDDRPGS